MCRFHKFPQERIQQRTLEEIVNLPVPQIQEQIVAVVNVFERRAVVQQLFFLKGGRERKRGKGGWVVRLYVHERQHGWTCPSLPSLCGQCVGTLTGMSERVQARLLFGR